MKAQQQWLVALASFLLSQTVLADTCGYSGTEGTPPVCEAPKSIVTQQAACPTGSGMWGCYEPTAMPPAEMFCDSAYGVVSCEAWPQTNQFLYQYVFTPVSGVTGWSSSGPEFTGNCTGRSGRVSVTVIHPSGQSSSVTVPFACLQNQ